MNHVMEYDDADSDDISAVDSAVTGVPAATNQQAYQHNHHLQNQRQHQQQLHDPQDNFNQFQQLQHLKQFQQQQQLQFQQLQKMNMPSRYTSQQNQAEGEFLFQQGQEGEQEEQQQFDMDSELGYQNIQHHLHHPLNEDEFDGNEEQVYYDNNDIAQQEYLYHMNNNNNNNFPQNPASHSRINQGAGNAIDRQAQFYSFQEEDASGNSGLHQKQSRVGGQSAEFFDAGGTAANANHEGNEQIDENEWENEQQQEQQNEEQNEDMNLDLNQLMMLVIVRQQLGDDEYFARGFPPLDEEVTQHILSLIASNQLDPNIPLELLNQHFQNFGDDEQQQQLQDQQQQQQNNHSQVEEADQDEEEEEGGDQITDFHNPSLPHQPHGEEEEQTQLQNEQQFQQYLSENKPAGGSPFGMQQLPSKVVAMNDALGQSNRMDQRRDEQSENEIVEQEQEEEEATICMKCGQLPSNFIELNCTHSFCLECMAKLFLDRGYLLENRIASDGFIDTHCMLCEEITSLEPNSVQAITEFVLVILQQEEQLQFQQLQQQHQNEQQNDDEQYSENEHEQQHQQFHNEDPNYHQQQINAEVIELHDQSDRSSLRSFNQDDISRIRIEYQEIGETKANEAIHPHSNQEHDDDHADGENENDNNSLIHINNHHHHHNHFQNQQNEDGDDDQEEEENDSALHCEEIVDQFENITGQPISSNPLSKSSELQLLSNSLQSNQKQIQTHVQDTIYEESGETYQTEETAMHAQPQRGTGGNIPQNWRQQQSQQQQLQNKQQQQNPFGLSQSLSNSHHSNNHFTVNDFNAATQAGTAMTTADLNQMGTEHGIQDFYANESDDNDNQDDMESLVYQPAHNQRSRNSTSNIDSNNKMNNNNNHHNLAGKQSKSKKHSSAARHAGISSSSTSASGAPYQNASATISGGYRGVGTHHLHAAINSQESSSSNNASPVSQSIPTDSMQLFQRKAQDYNTSLTSASLNGTPSNLSDTNFLFPPRDPHPYHDYLQMQGNNTTNNQQMNIATGIKHAVSNIAAAGIQVSSSSNNNEHYRLEDVEEEEDQQQEFEEQSGGNPATAVAAGDSRDSNRNTENQKKSISENNFYDNLRDDEDNDEYHSEQNLQSSQQANSESQQQQQQLNFEDFASENVDDEEIDMSSQSLRGLIGSKDTEKQQNLIINQPVKQSQQRQQEQEQQQIKQLQQLQQQQQQQLQPIIPQQSNKIQTDVSFKSLREQQQQQQNKQLPNKSFQQQQEELNIPVVHTVVPVSAPSDISFKALKRENLLQSFESQRDQHNNQQQQQQQQLLQRESGIESLQQQFQQLQKNRLSQQPLPIQQDSIQQLEFEEQIQQNEHFLAQQQQLLRLEQDKQQQQQQQLQQQLQRDQQLQLHSQWIDDLKSKQMASLDQKISELTTTGKSKQPQQQQQQQQQKQQSQTQSQLNNQIQQDISSSVNSSHQSQKYQIKQRQDQQQQISTTSQNPSRQQIPNEKGFLSSSQSSASEKNTNNNNNTTNSNNIDRLYSRINQNNNFEQIDDNQQQQHLQQHLNTSSGRISSSQNQIYQQESSELLASENCPIHPSEEIQFFDFSTNKCLCLRCLQNGDSANSPDDSIVSLDRGMTQLVSRSATCSNQIRICRDLLTMRLQACEEKEATADRKWQAAKQEIERQLDNLVERVQQKKFDLIADAESKHAHTLDSLSETLSDLANKRELLTAIATSFQTLQNPKQSSAAAATTRLQEFANAKQQLDAFIAANHAGLTAAATSSNHLQNNNKNASNNNESSPPQSPSHNNHFEDEGDIDSHLESDKPNKNPRSKHATNTQDQHAMDDLTSFIEQVEVLKHTITHLKGYESPAQSIPSLHSSFRNSFSRQMPQAQPNEALPLAPSSAILSAQASTSVFTSNNKPFYKSANSSEKRKGDYNTSSSPPKEQSNQQQQQQLPYTASKYLPATRSEFPKEEERKPKTLPFPSSQSFMKHKQDTQNSTPSVGPTQKSKISTMTTTTAPQTTSLAPQQQQTDLRKSQSHKRLNEDSYYQKPSATTIQQPSTKHQPINWQNTHHGLAAPSWEHLLQPLQRNTEKSFEHHQQQQQQLPTTSSSASQHHLLQRHQKTDPGISTQQQQSSSTKPISSAQIEEQLRNFKLQQQLKASQRQNQASTLSRTTTRQLGLSENPTGSAILSPQQSSTLPSQHSYDLFRKTHSVANISSSPFDSRRFPLPQSSHLPSDDRSFYEYLLPSAAATAASHNHVTALLESVKADNSLNRIPNPINRSFRSTQANSTVNSIINNQNNISLKLKSAYPGTPNTHTLASHASQPITFPATHDTMRNSFVDHSNAMDWSISNSANRSSQAISKTKHSKFTTDHSFTRNNNNNSNSTVQNPQNSSSASILKLKQASSGNLHTYFNSNNDSSISAVHTRALHANEPSNANSTLNSSFSKYAVKSAAQNIGSASQHQQQPSQTNGFAYKSLKKYDDLFKMQKRIMYQNNAF